MVEPVSLSTSALLLPERLISSACWVRRPKTTEQPSTRMIGSRLLSLVFTAFPTRKTSCTYTTTAGDYSATMSNNATNTTMELASCSSLQVHCAPEVFPERSGSEIYMISLSWDPGLCVPASHEALSSEAYRDGDQPMQ